MRIEGTIPASEPREQPRHPDMPRRLSVALLGGGDGLPAILSGLSRFAPGGHAMPPIEFAAVVASTSVRPRPMPLPRELLAIRRADVVVIGPGDLHRSVLPSIRAPGVAAVLRECGALRILIGNLATREGGAAHQVRAVQSAAGLVLDVALLDGEGANADERRELAALGVLPIEADLRGPEGRPDPLKLAAAVLGLAVEALVV